MSTGLDKETLDIILSAVRDFAAKRCPPDLLRELDASHECPEDILREMYSPQFGIHLLFIPEEYGGMGGSAYDVYRVSEAIARIDLGLASAVLSTFLGLDPIIVGGTPEQKRKWMSAVADKGLVVAYGVTEPTAGSDLAVIRTRADPIQGEDGELAGYRLNGSKQFITNGSIADFYTILARAPGGYTFFIVEKGAEGFTPGKPEDKHGIRISDTAPLTFDVVVPVENVVGGVEGEGMAQAQEVFGYTRLMVAAFGLGAGMAALERATNYARERVQAGSALIEKQAFTHKLLVPHAVRLEASRAYIEETSRRIDAGEENLGTEGAIAKLIATEAGNAAADAAIQALGGYGYMREYEVERIRRDVRITTIYEGTSEIMEWTIARDRWRDHLQSRGQYYAQLAPSLDALHARAPSVGADVAALALHALQVLLERARLGRLTRNQHILFRIGEWIALGESAGSMARYAAANSDKVSGFFPSVVEAMSRIYAREAALRLTTEGLRWVYGSEDGTDLAELERSLDLEAIHQAQQGLLADNDLVAQALRDQQFGR
jgi:alkylation response protein AidB-like acyl-CoA dehydrogenase